MKRPRLSGLTAVSVLSIALVSGVAGAKLATGGAPAPTSVTISPASDTTSTAPAPLEAPAPAPAAAPADTSTATAPRTVAEPVPSQNEDVATTPKTQTVPDVELRSTRRPAPAPKPSPVTMPTPAVVTAPGPTSRPEAPKAPPADCQEGMREITREGPALITRTCAGGKWVETSREIHEDPAAGPDPRGEVPAAD